MIIFHMQIVMRGADLGVGLSSSIFSVGASVVDHCMSYRPVLSKRRSFCGLAVAKSSGPQPSGTPEQGRFFTRACWRCWPPELVHSGQEHLKASPTGNIRQRTIVVTLCSCNLAPDSEMAWSPRWARYTARRLITSFCLTWNRIRWKWPHKAHGLMIGQAAPALPIYAAPRARRNGAHWQKRPVKTKEAN